MKVSASNREGPPMGKTLGFKIAEARKKLGMTQEALGNLVGLSKSAISKLEKGDLVGPPAPVLLIAIAETLKAPAILMHHCENCPIRQHIMLRLFPDLNNIRRDPAIIVSRLRKEMVEASSAAERLSERFSDANFRQRPDYLETFEREMEQILDVKRGIEILEFELLLSGVHTGEDLERVYAKQQKKCIDHGHHVPPAKATK